jgi:hypothetical protein
VTLSPFATDGRITAKRHTRKEICENPQKSLAHARRQLKRRAAEAALLFGISRHFHFFCARSPQEGSRHDLPVLRHRAQHVIRLPAVRRHLAAERNYRQLGDKAVSRPRRLVGDAVPEFALIFEKGGLARLCQGIASVLGLLGGLERMRRFD